MLDLVGLFYRARCREVMRLGGHAKVSLMAAENAVEAGDMKRAKVAMKRLHNQFQCGVHWQC